MRPLKRRLESVHRVRTPELVEFEFPLAGLMSRTLAWLLDVLVSTAGAAGLCLIAFSAMAVAPGLGAALAIVIWFLVSWGYFVFAEYRFAGRTLGKRVLGLRTLQISGVRVGFYQAAVRNLVRPLDNLPFLYLVGGALALLSRSFQRFGDIAAGTVVVRDRRTAIPSGLQPPAEALKLLGGDKKVAERLSRTSVQERELLISAVLRREELSMGARLKLFAGISTHVQERLGVARPEHLSDEKFVAALVGVMLGGPSKAERSNRS